MLSDCAERIHLLQPWLFPQRVYLELQDQAPSDPLLAPGLKKTAVLLSARGSGPRLLDFLRRLERLSLLVFQIDLSLKSGSSSKDKDGRVVVEPTELRLNLGLYARDDSPTAKPGKPG